MFDIIYFAEKWMNFVPTSEQRIFLLHVQFSTLYDRDMPQRVIAKSGQGTGKSTAVCIAVAWRLLRAEGSLVVITAPTAAQCREVFFAEFRRRLASAHPMLQEMFHVSATRAFVKHKKWGDSWAIISRTATDSDCLRGLHHPHMLVVCEEMSGVEDDVLATMIGTCSQEGNMFVGVGNPSKRDGMFARAFLDANTSQNWQRQITLSRVKLAEERPELCSPHAITALAREWGEDSDYYRVNVLGEFPKIGGDTIIPYDWIIAATQASMFEALKQSDPDRRTIALDFARFGGDENVIVTAHGNAVTSLWHETNYQPVQSVRRAKAKAKELVWGNKDFVFVGDATGMGQPLMDLLREPYPGESEEYRLFEWHNHGSSRMYTRKYSNLITRGWFELREKLFQFVEMGGPPVHLPNDRHLIEQLATMKYEFDNENRLKSWSKDKYKKETSLSSPDRAETVVMALCDVIHDEGMSMVA